MLARIGRRTLRDTETITDLSVSIVAPIGPGQQDPRPGTTVEPASDLSNVTR